MLTAPAGLCVNVEVSELNYPMRYLWRRERTDSGGPGIHRGGVGADNAYTPHLPGDRFGATMFAHGTEPPTSSGVLGGEPGMQNAFGIERDGVLAKRKAKEVVALQPDDVFHNWCAGGGGVGDPLDRAVDEVARDVDDGLVSVAGARRDYGVIVAADGAADGTVDVAGTEAERARRRRDRLGGREPAPKLDAPLTGRRLSSGLVALGEAVHCRWCGTGLGDAAFERQDHAGAAGDLGRLPVAARRRRARRSSVRVPALPLPGLRHPARCRGQPGRRTVRPFPGGRTVTITKLVFCVAKKPEMSVDDFRDYWLNRHGPLVRSLWEQGTFPGMLRYVQSHTIYEADGGRAARGTKPPYDGITEVWMDSALGATDDAASRRVRRGWPPVAAGRIELHRLRQQLGLRHDRAHHLRVTRTPTADHIPILR